MRIEGRDLVDFGEREFHLQGQRGEMGGGQIAVMVLDQMQVFDQQIAPARLVGEQRAHFLERRGVDLTALGRARRLAAACFGVRRSRLEVHERLWPELGQATFSVMCRNMARRASSSNSVLNLCLSLSAFARAAAGRAEISSTRRCRLGNLAQAPSPSAFGMSRAQPQTAISTMVQLSPSTYFCFARRASRMA